MSKGDRIAEYLREHHDPTQHLIWRAKVKSGEVDFNPRHRFYRVAKSEDGTACIVTRDERGYFVYGPYFTWEAGR